MTNYFNSIDILSTLNKWKKPLVITILVSALASFFFSSPLFIKPKFKSFAIIYPVNVSPFGSESTVEQMIQIMQSDELQFKIAKKFDLLKHYDIDADDEYAQSKLLKELEDNTSLNKTEFESVEIQILDTDPVLAMNLVNEYIHLYDEKELALQRDKTLEVVKIIKKQYDRKKLEMDSVETKLKELRVKYGILNYDAQTRVLARSYAKAMAKHSSDLPKLEEMKNTLEQRGGEFIQLSEHASRIRGLYNDFKVQYETTLKDYEKVLTHSNIITPPYPSDKKTYPVRWLIVLISVISTFFFALIVIYLIENSKIQKETKQA